MRHCHRYQVNYTDSANIKEISRFGDIEYQSKVLNFLFLTSSYDIGTIRNIEGVTFVRLQGKANIRR